jgi:hypothetical protein
VRRALALFALAALPAYGQVIVGGGGYGGYAPHAYAPYGIVAPWAAAVPPRLSDVSPACFRHGRCSPGEVAAYRYRVERLDRLAPSAPADPFAEQRHGPSAMPPPTAEEDIRPEYRRSSVVREAYRDSGRPIDGRP